MKIGDHVTWAGRRWVVLGFDPTGVTDPTILLEDPETGERAHAPCRDVRPDG